MSSLLHLHCCLCVPPGCVQEAGPLPAVGGGVCGAPVLPGQDVLRAAGPGAWVRDCQQAVHHRQELQRAGYGWGAGSLPDAGAGLHHSQGTWDWLLCMSLTQQGMLKSTRKVLLCIWLCSKHMLKSRLKLLLCIWLCSKHMLKSRLKLLLCIWLCSKHMLKSRLKLLLCIWLCSKHMLKSRLKLLLCIWLCSKHMLKSRLKLLLCIWLCSKHNYA